MSDALLESALRLAARGFAIFPIHFVDEDGTCSCRKGSSCERPGKHPIAQLSRRGFKDATTAPVRIRRWWTREPRANIGVATGSGLAVIDCDRRATLEGTTDGTARFLAIANDRGGLPETLRVYTGGGGAHFWFRVPEDEAIRSRTRMVFGGEPVSGIDVRADGGYVIAPPSSHASGTPYSWVDEESPIAEAPEWLLDELRSGRASPDPVAPSKPSPVKRSRRDIEEIREALSLIPADCDRDTWIRSVGMPLHDFFGGSEMGFELWAEWSATAEGHRDGKPIFPGEPAMRKQWGSFGRRSSEPVTIASLFGKAQEFGFTGAASGEPLESSEIDPGPEEDPEDSESASGEEDEAEGPEDEDESESLLGDRFGERDPGPFPEEVIDDFEGPLAECIDWMLRCARRPDPVLALGSSLALFSGILGRRVVSFGTRPILTMVVIAPSGAGKDKPQECVRIALEQNLDACVGVLDASPYHRSQLDEFLLRNDGQGLLLLDEYGSTLARWVGSGRPGADQTGTQMSQIIRRLASFGRGRYKLDSLSLKHPLRKEFGARWEAGIESPSMTLIGFSTPGQFFDSLTEASLVDGFLGRHIALSSRSTRNLRTPIDSPDHVPSELVDWIDSLASYPIPRTSRFASDDTESKTLARPTGPEEIPVSGSYEDAFDAIISEVDQDAHEAFADGQETRAAVLRRMPEQIAKLAFVIACGESPRLEKAMVGTRHLELATKIVRWSSEFLAWKLRRGVADSVVGQAYAKVLERIEAKKGGKVYRSKLIESLSIAPHLSQVWPFLSQDPRFETTPKWSRLRT